MKVAIIVLNYNGLDVTLDCLDSLANLKKDSHDVEIIVVDNDSQDGSVEALANLKEITLIKNTKNLGYSGGNNVGISEALKHGSDYILVLNNDTIVDESLLVNLLSDAKHADIISPKIYFAKGFEFHKSRYKKADQGKVIWYAGAKIDWKNILGSHFGVDEVDRGQYDEVLEIDFATGACFLAKKEVFEKVGFFDEKYFLYLEDMDFCVRAKRAGFRIIYQPKAFLWHKNASTSGGSGSNLQDYYITRNRLLFAFKFAKLKIKLALLKQVASQAKSSTKRRALVDFLTLNFGKGSFRDD